MTNRRRSSATPARALAGLLCGALLLALGGCAAPGQGAGAASGSATLPPASSSAAPEAPDAAPDAVPELLARLKGERTRRPVTEEFLRFCQQEIDPLFPEKLLAVLEEEAYGDDLFFDLTGYTLLVLQDLFTGAADLEGNLHDLEDSRYPPVIAITGDINLADDWENMQVLQGQENGLADCLSPALLKRMRAADLLLVNNEFTFSDRGSAMPGKLYTFRAATENVDLLSEMGVDVVSLANNHVYDYGEDAFLDTLDTLAGAGIPWVGAGRDLEEAQRPQYFLVGGIKLALVAASRAEKNILTPEATDTLPGVLRCYDDELFLGAVATAAANADVVIAYPHWGTENTTRLEAVQIELGQKLLAAGASAVVGAHPHCLQGIHYYDGRPVVYSLGNFWFNTETIDTALLEITLYSPHRLEVRVQPCLQRGGKTALLTEEADRERIFRHLESISDGRVAIDGEGLVAPVAEEAETDTQSGTETGKGA